MPGVAVALPHWHNEPPNPQPSLLTIVTSSPQRKALNSKLDEAISTGKQDNRLALSGSFQTATAAFDKVPLSEKHDKPQDAHLPLRCRIWTSFSEST